MALDPDSFRVSTSPRRTTVENSLPSMATASAAVAPPCMARRITSAAISFRSVEAGWIEAGRSAMEEFIWLRSPMLWECHVVAQNNDLSSRPRASARLEGPAVRAGCPRSRGFETLGDNYRYATTQVWKTPDLGHQNQLSTNYPPVPPTVSLSTFSVGIPTPTGTDCPSLPQVPTPSSSCRSLPTIETFVNTSGPLPMRVAFFSGAVILPSSIM